MENHTAVFDESLMEATAAIEADYMQLPVAGREGPQYRERVYCYELYHQLRPLLEARLPTYSLGGEVDKTGNPLIRGAGLDRVKPDLLVHVPRQMDRNLAVVEVKPVGVTRYHHWRRQVEKDIEHLLAFRRNADYRHAVYLVYGDNDIAFAKIRMVAAGMGERLVGRERLSNLVRLLLHPVPGERASEQPWP